MRSQESFIRDSPTMGLETFNLQSSQQLTLETTIREESQSSTRNLKLHKPVDLSEVLNRKIELDSILYKWGCQLRDEGKYDQAILKLKKATEENPKNQEAYSAWGDILESQGNYEDAISKYEEITRINPQDFQAYMKLGDMLFKQKKFNEAEAKYSEAIQKDSSNNNDSVYKKLGDALLQQGRRKEAEEKYKKTIEINANNDEAYYSWGECLIQMEDIGEAIKKFEHAVEKNRKNDRVLKRWGDLLQQKGLYEKAMEKYEEATQINAKNDEAYKDWGDCLKQMDRYEEAIEKYKQAISINTGNEEAYMDWAETLYLQEKYDEAKGKYEKAIEVNPRNKDAHFKVGLILFEKLDAEGETQELNKSKAALCFRRVIEIDQSYSLAYVKLAELFLFQDNYIEAEKICKDAPEDSLVYLTWGDVLFQKGDMGGAITKYKKVTEMGRDFIAEAHRKWGDALQAQGRPVDAKKHWDKAYLLESGKINESFASSLPSELIIGEELKQNYHPMVKQNLPTVPEGDENQVLQANQRTLPIENHTSFNNVSQNETGGKGEIYFYGQDGQEENNIKHKPNQREQSKGPNASMGLEDVNDMSNLKRNIDRSEDLKENDSVSKDSFKLNPNELSKGPDASVSLENVNDVSNLKRNEDRSEDLKKNDSVSKDNIENQEKEGQSKGDDNYNFNDMSIRSFY